MRESPSSISLDPSFFDEEEIESKNKFWQPPEEWNPRSDRVVGEDPEDAIDTQAFKKETGADKVRQSVTNNFTFLSISYVH